MSNSLVISRYFDNRRFYNICLILILTYTSLDCLFVFSGSLAKGSWTYACYSSTLTFDIKVLCSNLYVLCNFSRSKNQYYVVCYLML